MSLCALTQHARTGRQPFKLDAECEGERASREGQNETVASPDLDGDLLARFCCLGTTDKDVLVTELHSLLGAQLSKEGCEFFLEIGNWNLQAAVGAYYDFYGPVSTMPAISARDVSLCPGQKVPPNTSINKVWRISNTGAETWQSGTSLTLQTRNTLCGPARVLLPALAPGQEAEISVNLLSPAQPGVYQNIWRLTTPTGGVCAGQCLCAVVSVEGEEESGTEGDLAVLTQQLAAFSTSDHTNSQAGSSFGIGSSPPPPSPVNSLPQATDLIPPILPQHQFLSHSLPSSLPSPYGLCDMEEQPPSPPFQQTPQ